MNPLLQALRPHRGEVRANPLAGNTSDLHTVTFAAWNLVAFSIGVLAGLLIRRVVLAVFATDDYVVSHCPAAGPAQDLMIWFASSLPEGASPSA